MSQELKLWICSKLDDYDFDWRTRTSSGVLVDLGISVSCYRCGFSFLCSHECQSEAQLVSK